MSEWNWVWIPQSVFVEQFHVSVEDYEFPQFMGADSVSLKNNLASAVYKYLTKEMEIEDFIPVVKKEIKFTTEEIEIIDRKFNIEKAKI